jgi:hypothetical protein
MGHGILAISGFAWLGNPHGDLHVQAHTKVGKRFFIYKKIRLRFFALQVSNY